MIPQEIYIKRASWRVRVFHDATSLWADEIIDYLIRFGCRGENLTKAKENLWKGAINSGLTYSNCEKRESIMVIGHTYDGAEYWNSIDHEKNHLLQDIAETDGINPFGEEISYISGEFIREVYKKANSLLCNCCRKNAYRQMY